MTTIQDTQIEWIDLVLASLEASEDGDHVQAAELAKLARETLHA